MYPYSETHAYLQLLRLLSSKTWNSDGTQTGLKNSNKDFTARLNEILKTDVCRHCLSDKLGWDHQNI